MERGTIAWNMTNHAPTPEEINVIEGLRGEFIELGELIEDICPSTRERSLAITNLEQSLMWAVASIARNTESTADD